MIDIEKMFVEFLKRHLTVINNHTYVNCRSNKQDCDDSRDLVLQNVLQKFKLNKSFSNILMACT